MTTNKMLTAAQAAERIGVTTRTLFTYRQEGTGPTYVQYSPQTIRFPENELIEWLNARTVKAGSENSRISKDTPRAKFRPVSLSAQEDVA